MGRLGAPRGAKVQKVRFGAFGPKLSSATISKYKLWSHLSKSEEKFNFSKNKKVAKTHTFAFLHTCTAFSLDLGGQNRKSATFCTFCTLALRNRPGRTFAYVYDVFARSGRSKITFCAFGAYLVKSTTPGRRTLNRGGPPRGGGGFLPSLSPLGLSSL